MDYRHYITDLPERKSGQHLQREERGAIQALKRQGLSNRAIARELGCSPTTIGNELRRGTPPRVSRARVALRATVASTVKLYTVPIGSVPGNRANCFPAEHSYPGLLPRSENTSGLWMPAPATQNATDCFRATRWSVPTRSIMKRGQAIFPFGSWSCRKL